MTKGELRLSFSFIIQECFVNGQIVTNIHVSFFDERSGKPITRSAADKKNEQRSKVIAKIYEKQPTHLHNSY